MRSDGIRVAVGGPPCSRMGILGSGCIPGSCHRRTLTFEPPTPRPSRAPADAVHPPPPPLSGRPRLGRRRAASALPPAAAFARPYSPTIEVAPWPPLKLPDPPLREADYLHLADEVVRRLDRTWVEEERAYSAGGRVIDVIYNAALLTIHGVAAERGYDGRRATTRGRG